MAYHRFHTPILLVESFFSEFNSSNCQFDSPFKEVVLSLRAFVSSSCQFDSSAGLFDSSFYEFDSSLQANYEVNSSLLLETLKLDQLSLCNFWINTLRVNNRTAEQILLDSSICQSIKLACFVFHLGQYMLH